MLVALILVQSAKSARLRVRRLEESPDRLRSPAESGDVGPEVDEMAQRQLRLLESGLPGVEHRRAHRRQGVRQVVPEDRPRTQIEGLGEIPRPVVELDDDPAQPRQLHRQHPLDQGIGLVGHHSVHRQVKRTQGQTPGLELGVEAAWHHPGEHPARAEEQHVVAVLVLFEVAQLVGDHQRGRVLRAGERSGQGIGGDAADEPRDDQQGQEAQEEVADRTHLVPSPGPSSPGPFLFAQQLDHRRLHRLSSDLVAEGGEMEVVVHHLRGDDAFLVGEVVPDVEVEDLLRRRCRGRSRWRPGPAREICRPQSYRGERSRAPGSCSPATC